MTTHQLDLVAKNQFEIHRALSAPIQEGFPGYTCISVNEIIAHGVPDDQVLKEGDRVNIDVSASHKGYYGDIAFTTVLGEKDSKTQNLLECAQKCTNIATSMSAAGTKVNAIGKAIEDHAREHDFTIVKNLCSHGVGKSLHAFPENIINYYDPEEDLVLEPGMVIAWEPYVSTCAVRAIETSNDWNLTTHNKSHVAQFEHTVLVTDNGPEVLTFLDL